MDFYRGDNRAPTQGEGNICNVGFTLYPAYQALPIQQARQTISTNWNNLLTYMFGLRVTTPGGLISTAMIPEGAFEGKEYVYKITIPDTSLHLVELSKQGLGAAIPMATFNIRTYTKALLIMDNANFNLATNVLAIGHGLVATKEATFYTALPLQYVVGYRKKSEDQFQPLPPPLPPRP